MYISRDSFKYGWSWCALMLVIRCHGLLVVFSEEVEQEVLIHTSYINFRVKGVLHPRSVFGLFLHFSQKLQHIGNK